MAQTTSDKRPTWTHGAEGSMLIVGHQNLHNELLAYGLGQITGLRCCLAPKPDAGETTQDTDHGAKTLVLVDSTEARLDEIPKILAAYVPRGDPPVPLALYNLEPGYGREASAISHGVRGFFYVHETLELFLRGIQAILDGQIWLPRGILVEAVMSRLAGRGAKSDNHDGLTSRELEALSLLRQGTGNQQIAELLGVGRNTVRTHLHSAFRKIGVANRSQAALWAAKNLQ